jgi:hypothetical protein
MTTEQQEPQPGSAAVADAESSMRIIRENMALWEILRVLGLHGDEDDHLFDIERAKERARAAAEHRGRLYESLKEGQAGFRKLIQHHRDDHHDGHDPYDHEIASGLLSMERALLAERSQP